MPNRRGAVFSGCLFTVTMAVCLATLYGLSSQSAIDARPGSVVLDPAAWGGDHVGQPVADYMTGDECLFCHRKKIGPGWAGNAHQSTIRPAAVDQLAIKLLSKDEDTRVYAEMTEYLLGDELQTRFLKRGKGYGTLDMLSTACRHNDNNNSSGLIRQANPQWSTAEFSRKCAGCHTTAVDSKQLTFSALSIDCYSCHGIVTLAHTKETSLVHLSRARQEPARVIASICGQCHIRNGRSRSSGLPFANNFVAGDNLFRDLKVDFNDAALAAMDPIDQHIMENIRDIVLRDKTDISCLSCHKVHGQSAEIHQELSERAICFRCHQDSRDWSKRKTFNRENRTCQY